MKATLTRVAIAGALVIGVSAPLTAPAQAWACLDPVTKLACLVAGTSCRAFDTVTGRGEICQLG
jgi:hypothetical protein